MLLVAIEKSAWPIPGQTNTIMVEVYRPQWQANFDHSQIASAIWIDRAGWTE